MSDANPRIGLIAAFLAVIALPVAVQLYRAMTPRLAVGPDELVAAAQRIDQFWADNFRDQFPDAWTGYSTPALSFDDIEENDAARNDGYAGFYRNGPQSIHVDLDRDRGEGYLLLVLAHEYGHHVQNLSGQRRVRDASDLWLGDENSRRLGVRYELQAECLAGVWAHYAAPRGEVIDRRDVENWRSLSFFGGDSDTHGSARQRLRWFNAGYERGAAGACDTFEVVWESL